MENKEAQQNNPPNDAVHYEPVNPGEEAQLAEGTVLPASDEEQVATLRQTPPEELAVDPNIPQPSQDPNVAIESDVEVDE